MGREARGNREDDVIFRAFAALLPGVDSLVSDQVRATAEALPAVQAFERFLSGVDSLVGFEARFLTEALATVWAVVQLLPRVEPLVRSESCPPVEPLPAIGTLVGFLAGVDSLMSHEAGFVAEDLPAHGTLVPFLCFLSSWPERHFAEVGLQRIKKLVLPFLRLFSVLHFQAALEPKNLSAILMPHSFCPNVTGFLLILTLPP